MKTPRKKTRTRKDLSKWNGIPARVKREIVNILEFWKEEK